MANVIEVVIRAKDEASAQIKGVEQALGAAEGSFAKFAIAGAAVAAGLAVAGAGIKTFVDSVKQGATVERVLLDEKAQDALLLSSLVEPKVGTDIPDLAALGKHRDTLILAILNRLSGVEAVDAARFPGEAPAGEPDRADGAGDGDAPVASAPAVG